MSKRVLLIVGGIAAAVWLLVAAGASARHEDAAAKTVVISTRQVGALGVILVNGKGRTLYMFVPDKRKRVTCEHTCAAVWPPLFLAEGAKVKTKGKAKASLAGSDRDPAGGTVVTYHGWPLYTYIGDTAPGQAKGQALDLNGGFWYVLAPSGKVIRTKVAGKGSQATRKPTATVTFGSDVAVKGKYFKEHEKVTVTLSSATISEKWTKTSTASAAGAFSLSFGHISLNSCDQYTLKVVGSMKSTFSTTHDFVPC